MPVDGHSVEQTPVGEHTVLHPPAPKASLLKTKNKINAKGDTTARRQKYTKNPRRNDVKVNMLTPCKTLNLCLFSYAIGSSAVEALRCFAPRDSGAVQPRQATCDGKSLLISSAKTFVTESNPDFDG
jgi:hypothetical protein